MSRFLRLLESVRRGGQGFGFTARIAAAPPALAVLAVVRGMDPRMVRAVAEEGADAVALSVSLAGLKKEADLKSAVEAARDKPVGLLLESPVPEVLPEAEWWGRSGVDFLMVTSDQPASLLAADVAKVVSVDLGFDPMQVRAFDGLSVDGFVVAARDDAGTGLSIGDAARYRLLAGVTGKPVLVALAAASDQAELRTLSQAGVDGVALLTSMLGEDAVTAGSTVAKIKATIAQLGPRKPSKNRAGQAVPLLPRLSQGTAAEGQEEERG